MNEITPEKIGQWLEETNRSRAWLASQCEVSINTVNGWLAKNSKRAIPKPTLKLIENLITSSRDIDPMFTIAQYEQIKKKADEMGLTVEGFIKAVLFDKVEE